LQAYLNSLDIVPDWEYAIFSENEVESYLEIPLITDTKMGFGPPDADESQIRQSDRRLVVREIKETGKMYLYTSLWIPDDTPSLIAMPSLTMFDKGMFSGTIYFFTLDGLFYWGAGFENGEPVSSETIVAESDIDSLTLTSTRSQTRAGSGCVLEYRDWYTCRCADGVNPKDDTILDKCDCEYIYTQFISLTCDDGGGGGGGYYGGDGYYGGGIGSGPPVPEGTLANKLFINNGLKDEQWKDLDAMLRRIFGICMGEHLIDALAENGRFSISFNPSLDGKGGFSNGNFIFREFEDGVLFHEMFHAWQWYQETVETKNASMANRELEAYLAQYRLTGELPPYKYSWNIIKMSKEYISKGGYQITPSNDLAIPFDSLYMNTIKVIQEEYKPYHGGNKIPFDSERSFDQNFKNLQYLTKGC
jgi:hypothetical protein